MISNIADGKGQHEYIKISFEADRLLCPINKFDLNKIQTFIHDLDGEELKIVVGVSRLNKKKVLTVRAETVMVNCSYFDYKIKLEGVP